VSREALELPLDAEASMPDIKLVTP